MLARLSRCPWGETPVVVCCPRRARSVKVVPFPAWRSAILPSNYKETSQVSRESPPMADAPGGPTHPRRCHRSSLAEELCDAIARELIFSEVVPPGQPLPPEKELGARYSVSRPTVR